MDDYRETTELIRKCKSLLEAKRCYTIDGRKLHLVKRKRLFSKFRELYNMTIQEYCDISVGVKTKSVGNYICFFVSMEYGFCLITFTNNPEKELCRVNEHCPFELTLLPVLNGTTKGLGKLHRRFRKNNVRGNWYRFEGDLRRFCKYNFTDYDYSVEKLLDAF